MRCSGIFVPGVQAAGPISNNFATVSRVQTKSSRLSAGEKLYPQQGCDAPPEQSVQVRAGPAAVFGLQRMAGGAGAEHSGAGIAGIGRQRILGTTVRSRVLRFERLGIPAMDRAVAAAAEQRPCIRQKGDGPDRLA